ncbi:TetR/AcrR family transcriptional regulator [Streptomyces sp. NBC_00370]|uniref:TetR/AcrR family transcriptional regulator n=1 Tax=Streptomyces sp. NBC_00370 TaxID=2975728 RepID=UPI002E2532DA
MTRNPRTDAENNRRHLVSVARAAFADEGLELPMREIARRAGLGVATLYRHFPTRTDLVTAALAEHVAGCRADMRAALAEPDAWRALSGTINRFAQRQVRDRGLNEALFGSHEAAAAFAEDRRAHARGLEQLVDRARRAGAVRAGLSVEDVRVGLTAIVTFRALRPEKAAASTQRLVNLLLAGLAAERDPAGDERPSPRIP